MKYTTLCRGINWDCSASYKKYNEINLLIKYTKNFLWRVAERLSYIQDAWCLKVKAQGFVSEFCNDLVIGRQKTELLFLVFMNTCSCRTAAAKLGLLSL